MPIMSRRRAALSLVLSVFMFFGNGAAQTPTVNRPVSKVITLLKDMSAQLEKEQKDDEEMYEKMDCWCKTNDKEKTKTISDAQAHITDLTSEIDEHTAESAKLTTEIADLKSDVAKSQQALDTAHTLRTNEASAFHGEEKDLLQSISALKSALVVLSKHHQPPAQAMLQGAARRVTKEQKDALHGAAAAVADVLQRHGDMLVGVLTPSQRRAASAFAQSPEDIMADLGAAFSQQTQDQSYVPQSGQVFGILQEMLATFEHNLSQTQKAEMNAQQTYEGLKTSKQEELEAQQAQLEMKEQEIASIDMKLAQAQMDIKDTQHSLTIDEQFILQLKQTCSVSDADWAERQKARQLEMTAVSKALAILASDDAHDLFTKTFNKAASLLQVHSAGAEKDKNNEKERSRREAAALILKKVAGRHASPRLSSLATRVKLDAFTQVIAAIDGMIAQLTQEKHDEILHKDFCVDELNTNQFQTEQKQRDKQDLMAKIEDTEMLISTVTSELTTLENEITTMQTELKHAQEDRTAENHVFQEVLADQRETQQLLHMALQVLEDVFSEPTPAGTALAQRGARQAPVNPPPPPGFGAYKKSSGSSGVIALLNQIITDAKVMETESIKSEETAQKAYVQFVQDTNASISSKQVDIVNKSQMKATAEGDLVQYQQDLASVDNELNQLSTYDSELHVSCDFITKNFNIRQEARDEEVEALQQAKAILSGADFGAFLQHTAALR